MKRTGNTNQPQDDRVEANKTPPRRRSARISERLTTITVSTKPAPQSSATMSEPRRNPKRKASEAANQLNDLPDKLLDEALARLSAQEIEEWEGWIELESEPVGFPHLCGARKLTDVCRHSSIPSSGT